MKHFPPLSLSQLLTTDRGCEMFNIPNTQVSLTRAGHRRSISFFFFPFHSRSLNLLEFSSSSESKTIMIELCKGQRVCLWGGGWSPLFHYHHLRSPGARALHLDPFSGASQRAAAENVASRCAKWWKWVKDCKLVTVQSHFSSIRVKYVCAWRNIKVE